MSRTCSARCYYRGSIWAAFRQSCKAPLKPRRTSCTINYTERGAPKTDVTPASAEDYYYYDDDDDDDDDDDYYYYYYFNKFY